VSGIGNIYADEALWRAKVNGARIAATLSRRQLTAVLDAAADVMRDALAKGGPRSTRCMSTSTASRGISTDRWMPMAAKAKAAAVWSGHPSREVYEPVVVLLPEMSAAAA